MKISIIYINLSLFLLLNSCSGFLDVTDLDELSSESVFKTQTDMGFALNHIYTFLPHPDLENEGELVPYFWTDDAIHRNINSQGRMGSDFNWLTVSQPGDTYILDDFYKYDQIADINFFLEALPDAEYTDESLRERHGAEARFMRAWLYERMIFVYGDVALITEVIPADALPSRDPRLEVFNWIVSELEEIASTLPVLYEGNDVGRFTKWAALALKARAHLNAIGWHNDVSGMYEAAESACAEIINSGQFELADGIEGFEAQFTTSSDLVSSETILSNIFIPELRTHPLARRIAQKGSWRGPAARFGNNQSRPGYTSDFIEEVQTINGLFPRDDPEYDPSNPWENRDPRLRACAVLPGDELPAKGDPVNTYIYQPHPAIPPNTDDITRPSNPTGYGFKKYLDYDLQALDQGNSDYKIIRYSEILLMYAETLAARGNDEEALEYLDRVRARVGMPLYSDIGLPTITRGTTGNGMIDAILLERRYEFAAEGPQRWFDIWRYKLGDQVIGQVFGIPESTELPGDLDGPKFKPDGEEYNRVWQEKFYLLPMRQSILDANPNISQNPGW
ncbi:RagB/SusD family nutrient uptake outer membrane protein [Membranihabitans maritimus]|uniref:RagB/SusD family nutrient uptake outer membrane protein n=1 Tax=Membranihabitans maritimus TaxID=2904244 RepID=UPI001F41D042|nr:RagB/SusD family nutrient uptake outer membrane protein [Membranihabitans maritimus]